MHNTRTHVYTCLCSSASTEPALRRSIPMRSVSNITHLYPHRHILCRRPRPLPLAGRHQSVFERCRALPCSELRGGWRRHADRCAGRRGEKDDTMCNGYIYVVCGVRIYGYTLRDTIALKPRPASTGATRQPDPIGLPPIASRREPPIGIGYSRFRAGQARLKGYLYLVVGTLLTRHPHEYIRHEHSARHCDGCVTCICTHGENHVHLPD